MFADWVLHSSLMEGAAALLETAKTKIFGTGEAARMGMAVATSKGMSALMLGQLVAVSALAAGMVELMGVVTLVVVKMMGAIASALVAGVYTAPLAVPVFKAAIGLGIAGIAAITAGHIAIGAATIAAGAAITGSLAAFAEGCIVTGPTLGLIGEAGPEAVIPLSKRGNMGGEQTIIVQLNERTLLQTNVRGMPRYVRLYAGRT